MAEPSSTLREQQFALARHVRDPSANPPPPGIEERRLAIYRQLFHDNIESLLSGHFPVIRKTLGDAAWQALVREFHAQFRCHSPLFTEIGREFIRFLEERQPSQDQPSQDDDPPWLQDLAHYEWGERALQIADDEMPGHVVDGDLLEGIPMVSPFAWALAYRWPVHRIGPGYQPRIAPEAPTLLLVRRDVDGYVHFSELSPPVYRLLEMLGCDPPMRGREALSQLAAEAQPDDVGGFLDDGASMLRRLHAEGVVLGTRAA